MSVARPAAAPGRQVRWDLWIPADHLIPVELRPRTKNGKPKRMPPRYPPNINERRAMHWQVERRVIEKWRARAAFEARRHPMRMLERVRISARVYRRALGVADASGDAERLKPLVDGLVDANVIPNDTRRYVEYGPVEERRTGYRGDGILLTVESLEVAE